MKKIFTIAALWFLWGFTLGTFILLGPLRYAVDYARANNWPGWQESLVVFGFIALLIIVSFGIAFVSSNIIQSTANKGKKTILFVVPLLTALLSVALFLNPDLINKKDQESKIAEGYTTGPYPTEEKLEELQSEGYTTVISLLHPAVIPFEPKLLAEEKANAKKAGINLVHIPLLPWITDNEESIDSLRRFIRNTRGRFYVHCYLGRDRVNVAKLVILQESKHQILDEQNQNKARSLDSIASFERGNIYKLANKTYLTPLPTKEEYFGYVIAAGYKQVIYLKDLKAPGASEAINEEQQWLAPYKISLKVFDIGNNISEANMKLIVDSVKSIKEPMVIHAFRSDEAEPQLFMKLYKGI